MLSGLRKERDIAPHLSAGPSSRLGTQPQISSVASRRTDARENGKKKAGEANEDWRRGSCFQYTSVSHVTGNSLPGAEPRTAREESK